MTTALRIIRSIMLASWVGALIFFGAVAAVAFANLPDAHLAGLVVRGSLVKLHHFGLIEGFVYLLVTLALLASQRDSHPVRAVELILVIVMLGLTTYSQMSIMPRMERDRLALGGDVAKASADNPAYRHFNRLHGLSVKFEGATLILGLLTIALAPIHGREDFDRFA